jgi:hypothetical protein
MQSLDVSDRPELLRLAEEVRDSGTPRLLRRGDESLARIVPLKPAGHARKATIARKAFLQSAGSWKGLIDPDRCIADIYESRQISSRPPVELRVTSSTPTESSTGSSGGSRRRGCSPP